jgi:hypothetical protein
MGKMKIKSLIIETHSIVKSDGWFTLWRLGLPYLKDLLRFEYHHVYLEEQNLADIKEPDFRPELQEELSFFVVTTNQQLDELLNSGYSIQSISMSMESLRRRLNKGAIATLGFVGHELAYRGFMALNEQAMRAIEPYPYKVDFNNSESCHGNARTVEKYRGKGIMSYVTFETAEFLRERGIQTKRASIGANNIPALKANAKKNSKVYGKGRYMRILWYKFWKESRFPTSVPISDFVSTLKLT